MVGAPVHMRLPLGLPTHMGGVGLDDRCLYGAIGAGRVVGAATAVWHGVTNRRSIDKWLGVMHMAWGGGVMCTCIEELLGGVIAHGLAVATEEAYPEAYRGP